MSNNKEFNLPETRIKSKLNDIWTEVQTNLPTINFDDDDANPTENESLKYDEIDKEFLDKYDYVQDFLDTDEDFSVYDTKNNDHEHDELSLSKNESLPLNEVKLMSSNAAHLNQFDNKADDDAKTKHRNKKINNMNTFLNGANTKSSAKSAEKITKSIFDTTNSKLSMEIFDNINIDDLLSSVKEKSTQACQDSNQLNKSFNYKTSYNLNDENILQKLAEMSMQMTNDKELANLDFKTGAISIQNNHNVYNDRYINHNNKPIMSEADHMYLNNNLKSSFSLIEKELKHNNGIGKESIFNIDDEITKDLNSYLKSHNIRDGNLVETRRLDLRSSQNAPQNQINSFSKKDLFNSNYKNLNEQMRNNLKFLNDNSSSSSSSSDSSDNDEENDKSLWIERYRRQKQMQKNSTNT